MTVSPHVVVIGAGTLGMCTALNLVEQSARVTVLEARSIASGSSGRSVGVVGSQLTDPFEIMLRVHSLRRFRQWEGEGLQFNHIGYLRLARTPAQMELFARSVEIQREAGLRSRLVRANELRDLVPHINPDGLEGGLFGPDNGFLDPHEMCNLLADIVRAKGGEVRQYRKLLGALRRPGGYTLETDAGPMDCEVVVNAGGAWIDTPVYGREKLPLDAVIEGPAILEQMDATTVLEPGDRARSDADGNIVIDIGGA